MAHDFCSIPLGASGEHPVCAVCGYRPPYELIADAAATLERWPEELEAGR